MSSFLLDTGLIIRHLRGQRQAIQLMRGLAKTGRLGISSITRLEIYAGMHPEEKFATRKLLSRFVTYDLDKETADRAGELIYQARTQQIGLSLPDAIIGATAVQNNLTLVTLNQGDFTNIPGLRIHPLD